MPRFRGTRRAILNPRAKFLLDSYAATAAYSTRQLRTGQTNALKLRRDSDNAESDFGFDGNGDLDTSAISTWLGGASGYIVTWYDQSGNGNYATQSTEDNQPLYVASGQNSRPVLRFDGSNDALVASTSPIGTGDDISVFVSIAGDSVSVSDYRAILSIGAHASGFWFARYTPTSPDRRHIQIWNNIADLRTSFGSYPNTAVPAKIITHIKIIDTSSTHYWDGVQQVQGTDADETAAMSTGGTINICGATPSLGTSNPWDGDLMEMILFNTNQSANRTAIETDINNYWSIF